MYYSGHPITLVPCKCRVDNEVAVAKVSLFSMKGINNFDTLVNNFEYYNCNSELGRYTHYYVEERDMDEYVMCNAMCNNKVQEV